MSGSAPPANGAGSAKGKLAEGAEAGGADPSMEDILASIRRILNEDESPGAAPEALPPSRQPVPGPAEADEGVFMLDEAMLVSKPPVAAPSPDLPPPAPSPAAKPVAEGGPSGLMDPGSAAAAKTSMGTLLRTLSSERTAQVHRGGPTIEDLVREEVRPLLKSWLDEHLPPMVERVVRQEIERLTSRTTP